MARKLFHFSGTVGVETEGLNYDCSDVVTALAKLLADSHLHPPLTPLTLSAHPIDAQASVIASRIDDVPEWLEAGM